MNLIDKALEIAGEGYPVFPCNRNKRPSWSNKELDVPGGEGGLKIATRDPEEIKRLFAHPRAVLIGVPTGAASGICVIDIDVKDGKHGQDWYDNHQADLGGTRWHKTHSGGMHLVYESNGVDPGTSAGVIHDGIDVRAEGGYIIWWPAHGCEYGDVELALFPDWIAQEAQTKASTWAAMPDSDLEQQILDASNFHQPMISLACRMAHSEASPAAIMSHLANIFDRSVAASADHQRHRDWTRRRRDIERVVGSALDKVGYMPAETVATPACAKAAGAPKPGAPRVLTSLEFASEFVPPDYIIDQLIQQSYVYSLTGRTGDGKTATLIYLAFCVEPGEPFAGHETERGTVLYLAGENSDDARVRAIVTAERAETPLDNANILWVTAPYDLKKWHGEITEKVAGHTIKLVIIDTASAYFPGDDENSNKQAGDFARLIRNLFTSLPDRPAVLVACHPTKNAKEDQLLPRGGGAFLAEVDGNFTVTADDETVELHWQGKLRGPGFDPIALRFVRDVTSEQCKDTKGRPLRTVVVEPMTAEEVIAQTTQRRDDQDTLIDVMRLNPYSSISDWADYCGWTTGSDRKPHKSKVHRQLIQLKRLHLAKKDRAGQWMLTTKGQQILLQKKVERQTPKSLKYNRSRRKPENAQIVPLFGAGTFHGTMGHFGGLKPLLTAPFHWNAGTPWKEGFLPFLLGPFRSTTSLRERENLERSDAKSAFTARAAAVVCRRRRREAGEKAA